MHDTIAIAERLETAGMQQRIAKVVAQELANNGERLATKEDIVSVKEDINRLEKSTKEDIVGVKEDINRLEKSTKEDIASVKEDINRLEKSTKEDIVGVKEDINRLEKSTKEDIMGVKEDVRRSKGRLLVFLGLFIVLQTSLMTLLLWLFTRVLG